MDDTTPPTNPNRLPGIARKQLDNPRRDKPLCDKPISAADAALADELATVLRDVPDRLAVVAAGPFPLLTRLAQTGSRGAATARRLALVAARIHAAADERRTAEYLLRHRREFLAGERSASALLSAARGAAEMDIRRVRWLETPLPTEHFAYREAEPRGDLITTPSVADVVVDYARAMLGRRAISTVVADRLHDAVVVAMEVAEDLAQHGCGRPIRGMRSDARAAVRLSCRLAVEFGDHQAARSVARLLVGPDRKPVESGLLWWVTHRETAPDEVPDELRRRWLRDLADADPQVRSRRTQRRARERAPQWMFARRALATPATSAS